MMQLRSTSQSTVMDPEQVVKMLTALQRNIGGCLRPNRSASQKCTYGEAIAQAIVGTDGFVSSSLQWDNIFGVHFPTIQGEM